MKTEVVFREALRQKVVGLATAQGSDASALNDTAGLLGLGLLDSTSVLELLVWIEEESGLELDTDELEKLGSISQIAAHVVSRSKL